MQQMYIDDRVWKNDNYGILHKTYPENRRRKMVKINKGRKRS